MPGELLGLHTLSGGLSRKRLPGLIPEVHVEHEGSPGLLMAKLRTRPGEAVRVFLSQVVHDRRANEPSRGNPLRGSVRVDGVTFEGRQSKRESPSHCPCSTSVLPGASVGLGWRSGWLLVASSPDAFVVSAKASPLNRPSVPPRCCSASR
jgi:hypothetical protein